MVGTVRGIIPGTMATTVGAILIILVGAILIIPVGAILTGTILTMAGAAVAMPIMARLAHATTESHRTILRAVRLTGVRTAIPAELSVGRATAASAIAIQPHAATRVPFRVARMEVTAIPTTAISAGRARPMVPVRLAKAIRRVATALRVVRAVRVSAAAPTAVRVAEAAVEASLVAVPLAAVVAAEVAADLEAAGNYNLRMYHLQFI